MDEPEVMEPGGAAPPKKKKLFLFIILGLGVLLLAGGGFFAYTKFMAPAPVAKDDGEKKGEPIKSVGVIYALQPFIVNLADPKGKRYLKIKIEVEVGSEALATRLQQLDARLRDTVIMLLSSLSFEEVMTPEGKIRIRDELMDRFNQAIKPDRISNIYFTELVVQ